MAAQELAAHTESTDILDAPPNVLSLVAAQVSKITNVNLYAGRAEITRCFNLALLAGQNQVTIRGLPFRLQQDSVRVEGRGNASIHDVVISTTPRPPQDSEKSAAANSLQRKRLELKNQIASVKQARSSLDTYLGTLKANETDIGKLEEIYSTHGTLAHKFDNNILDLEQELAEVKRKERLLVQDASASAELASVPWQVAINVWAQRDEDVEIQIKYVVANADWSAGYDIRADTQSDDKNITILYKAAITQNTGESWDGVPLTLETATPTLGMVAPSLLPWYIAETVVIQPSIPFGFPMTGMAMSSLPTQPVIVAMSRSRSRSPRRRSRSRSHSRSPRREHVPPMQHQVVSVTNKGTVSATFRVPGYINVPSDGQKHNVTVATLEFKVPLLWYTIPKEDARVYMEAKIKNDSEYTFIPGSANVYVDGSFIATTSVPSVSPQESFSCSLGLDSSLRVTYDRKDINTNVTGFYKKSTAKTITRRITITNTKSIPIANLKVVDNIPVSQDERIQVNLLQPTLPSVSTSENLQRSRSLLSGDKANSSKEKVTKIKATPGAVAQWDGAGDLDVNQELVGKNGRVRWAVSLRPQEIITLVLKCEVSFPENLRVTGI